MLVRLIHLDESDDPYRNPPARPSSVSSGFSSLWLVIMACTANRMLCCTLAHKVVHSRQWGAAGTGNAVNITSTKQSVR